MFIRKDFIPNLNKDLKKVQKQIMNISWKNMPGRGKSKCKDPEERVSLEVLGTATSIVWLKENEPGVG